MLPGTTPSPENKLQEGGPRSTHLSCGLVSSSGSLGVRLAATRCPASPQTDPAGSRPAATANCACASGRAGGCGLQRRPQCASRRLNRRSGRTPRPRAWGGVPGTRSSQRQSLSGAQAASSASCSVLRVAPSLAPGWMMNGWMEWFGFLFLFSFLSLVLF